jgi:hypothetical protein
MNIFFLDKSPIVSARAMTNKHVVKMILETAQLLSTAHHVLDDTINHDHLYKKTHVNHPSAVWVRESHENYLWTYKHFLALCKEYTKRYGKVHATEIKLKNDLAVLPLNIPKVKQTKIKLAITNKAWHKKNPIESYRIYYENEKLKTHEDKQRYDFVLSH